MPAEIANDPSCVAAAVTKLRRAAIAAGTVNSYTFFYSNVITGDEISPYPPI